MASPGMFITLDLPVASKASAYGQRIAIRAEHGGRKQEAGVANEWGRKGGRSTKIAELAGSASVSDQTELAADPIQTDAACMILDGRQHKCRASASGVLQNAATLIVPCSS